MLFKLKKSLGFCFGRVGLLLIYTDLDSFRVWGGWGGGLGFWYFLGRFGSVVGSYQKQEQTTDPRSQLGGS
jgi:hypothetical protein